MERSRVLIGVVLVAVVATAVLLWQRPTAPPVGDGPANVGDAPAATVAGADAVVAGDGIADRRAEVATPDADAAAAAAAAAAAGAGPEPLSVAPTLTTSLRLIVLDVHRKPIAGAVVRVTPQQWTREEALGVDDATFVRETAPREAVTDANGIAAVARFSRQALVTVRAGDRVANRIVDGRDVRDPTEIVFRDPRPLTIRVVDASGRPRGHVTLAVCVGVAARHEQIAQLTSNPDTGLAVLESVEEVLLDQHADATRRFGGTSGDPTLWISADEAGVTSAGVATSLRRIGTAPIELRLPGEGTLRLRLADAAAANAADPFVVHVVGVSSADRRQTVTRPIVRPLTPPSHAADVTVGVGGEFLVLLEDGAHRTTPVARVIGPRTAGEVVDVTITPPVRAELRGRLLLADGAPFASSSFTFHPIGAGAGPALDGRTEATGRFRLAVPTDSRWQTFVVRSPWNGGAAWFATLPGGVRAEVHDLGDLRATSATRLVEGRVVDANGRNVFRPELVVERSIVDADGARTWAPATDVTVAIDRTGSFRVDGPDAGMPMRVTASRSGSGRSAPTPFVVGAKDLRVVLRAGGVVVGRTRGLPGRTSNTRVTATAPGHEPQSTWIRGDGTFVLSDVPPATWTIEFALPGAGVVATVPGVVVAAGAPTSDPRLADVDLGTLRSLRFAVETHAGLPARGAVRNDAGDRLPLDAYGGATLWTNGAPLRVTVEPANGAPFVVDGVTDDRVVRLPR